MSFSKREGFKCFSFKPVGGGYKCVPFKRGAINVALSNRGREYKCDPFETGVGVINVSL